MQVSWPWPALQIPNPRVFLFTAHPPTNLTTTRHTSISQAVKRSVKVKTHTSAQHSTINFSTEVKYYQLNLSSLIIHLKETTIRCFSHIKLSYLWLLDTNRLFKLFQKQTDTRGGGCNNAQQLGGRIRRTRFQQKEWCQYSALRGKQGKAVRTCPYLKHPRMRKMRDQSNQGQL